MDNNNDQERRWATHYTFTTFTEAKTYYIPKAELQTWHDLKYELTYHINIEFQFINIAINGKSVFYQLDTLLADIDIKQKDICLIFQKPFFNVRDPRQVERQRQYEEMEKQSMRDNKQRIERENSDPFYERRLKLLERKQYKQIYQKVVKEYSKWECLIALEQCSPQYVREYLANGKAKLFLKEQQEKKQITQIDNFLIQSDFQQLKKTVFDNDKTSQTYGRNMRELYRKYPLFKKLEVNHQKYIQIKLLGRPLYRERNIKLQQDAQEIIKRAQQRNLGTIISKQELKSFNEACLNEGFAGDQITQAITQAGNNLQLAKYILRKGFADNSKNIKRQARLNLILQFFSHPTLDRILPSLKGNKPKCEAFLDFIIKKQKDQICLVALIQEYKLQIMSILTSIYCIKSQRAQSNKKISFQSQVSEQNQELIMKQIEDSIDDQIVDQLKMRKVDEKLAVSSVRAAKNQITDVEKYLWLGGINKRYDFCPQNPQSQQIYLYKYFKKEEELLSNLKDDKFLIQWLGSIKQTAPNLYKMTIRNKDFFDKMIDEAVQK